jgi:DNA mismatch repair ATPase MutS
VRKGENNILDMTRKTFLDTLSQVKEEFEIIKSEIGDPRMKLFYNEKKRFYISIDKKYFKPDDFIVTRKRGNKYFCTNGPLESLGNRITDLKNDIINISYKLLEDLINYLKSNITLLYSLSGFIANLDIICAFTEYAINNLICSKPLINAISKNIAYIYGKNCCHPLLNKVHLYKGNINENGGDNYQQDNIVPNDYFFINQFNILLLKGPNASGKTTYMKQLALLIIMAQIGSFVPCAYFSFNCRKFLYSNFNINSITKDLNNNQEYSNTKNNIKGSFIKQITEIYGIINNQNYTKSLILLDEPFENTHSQLMMEIVISLLDLISKNLSSSFAIISSHNDLVIRLSSFYFHSILGTMKVELNNDKNDFEFLYKFKFTPQYSYEIKQDEKEMENYGINLSRMIGMKPQIISYAEEISENYEENNFDEFVKTSIEMNVMKTFLVKLYKNLFEIIGEKKNYTIKEQIMISIKNLYDFIDNAFK